jgi:hypothetical protein
MGDFFMSKLFIILLSIITFILVGWLSWISFYNPSLNPTYEQDVRVMQPLDFGADNAAFILVGLKAPLGEKDIYQYGQKKSSRALDELQRVKQHYNIGPTYCTPSTDPLNLLEQQLGDPAQELTSFDMGIDALACLSQVPPRISQDTACASHEDLQKWIGENRVIWERYDSMVRAKNFVPVPEALENGEDLLILSQFKAADIITNVTNDPGYSYSQWYQGTMLARKMVASRTSIAEKSIYIALMGQYIKTIEALLYVLPEMAVSYGSAIEEALKPEGVAMYNAGNLLTDEWRLMEPRVHQSLSKPIGNGFLNRIHKCLKEASIRATMSANDFLKVRNQSLCSKSIHSNPILEALTTPGNIHSNIHLYKLVNEHFQASDMIMEMHHQDAHMRMVTLATRILSEKIPTEEIQDYLDNAPSELKSPLKESPFMWDESKGRIYYASSIDDDMETDFYIRME